MAASAARIRRTSATRAGTSGSSVVVMSELLVRLCACRVRLRHCLPRLHLGEHVLSHLVPGFRRAVVAAVERVDGVVEGALTAHLAPAPRAGQVLGGLHAGAVEVVGLLSHRRAPRGSCAAVRATLSWWRTAWCRSGSALTRVRCRAPAAAAAPRW